MDGGLTHTKDIIVVISCSDKHWMTGQIYRTGFVAHILCFLFHFLTRNWLLCSVLQHLNPFVRHFFMVHYPAQMHRTANLLMSRGEGKWSSAQSNGSQRNWVEEMQVLRICRAWEFECRCVFNTSFPPIFPFYVYMTRMTARSTETLKLEVFILNWWQRHICLSPCVGLDLWQPPLLLTHSSLKEDTDTGCIRRMRLHSVQAVVSTFSQEQSLGFHGI